MGYRIGIYPSQTHRAAIAAAKKVLAVLKRDGDTAAIESELATFQDREDAVNSASCFVVTRSSARVAWPWLRWTSAYTA